MKFIKSIAIAFNTVCIMGLYSCTDPDCPPMPDPVPVDSTFIVKWKTPIKDSIVANIGFESPILYKDMVIVPVGRPDISLTGFFVAYDKCTGQRLWEAQIPNEIATFTSMYLYQNIIVGKSNTDVFAFDVDQKQIIWMDNHDKRQVTSGPFSTLIGDKYYVSQDSLLGIIPNPYSALVRYDVHTGKREYILKEHNKDQTEYSCPALYVEPASGDSLLLFKRTFTSLDTAFPPLDVLAYNLSKRQILWEHKGFSNAFSSRNAPPLIYGDDMLLISDNQLYKYDITTGELLWKKAFNNNFPVLNGVVDLVKPKLIGDKVYIMMTSFQFVCLSADNGNIIWKTNLGIVPSPLCEDMLYVNDMILTTNGNVRGFDPSNGFMFLNKSTRPEAVHYNNIIYDPKCNMYYVADFYYISAFYTQKPK